MEVDEATMEEDLVVGLVALAQECWLVVLWVMAWVAGEWVMALDPQCTADSVMAAWVLEEVGVVGITTRAMFTTSTTPIIIPPTTITTRPITSPMKQQTPIQGPTTKPPRTLSQGISKVKMMSSPKDMRMILVAMRSTLKMKLGTMTTEVRKKVMKISGATWKAKTLEEVTTWISEEEIWTLVEEKWTLAEEIWTLAATFEESKIAHCLPYPNESIFNKILYIHA